MSVAADGASPNRKRLGSEGVVIAPGDRAVRSRVGSCGGDVGREGRHREHEEGKRE